jgi:hypothetical protein
MAEARTKSTGHRAKLVFHSFPVSHHSRYFWGAESEARAAEWVAKQLTAAKAEGYNPEVTIIAVSV